MKGITAIILIALMPFSKAFATGFEKDSLWSGEHSGKAGAAVSSAHGSEALYFNPARLGKMDARQTLSLDFSPTWAQFQSPMGAPEQSYDSELTLSPLFGLSYGHKFNDKWSVGLGSHIVGGTNIEYKNVSFGNYTDGHFKTYMAITEVALGASYQVTPAVSVGLAWRATLFQSDYHTVSRLDMGGNTVAAQTDFSNMKGEDFGGVRLGINYEPSEKWGMGVTYKSEVSIDASGSMKQTAFLEATGNPPPVPPFDQPVTDGSAKLNTKIPQAVTVGGHYQLNEVWRLFGEYSWIDYSVVERFDITATGYGPLPNVELKWKDQSVVRIAGEYTGLDKMPLRLGYFYSTAVTQKSYASPNYLGPASGHGISMGSGYELSEGLTVNGALEYYYDSGSVAASDQLNNAPHPNTPGVGDYKTTVFPAIHLGLTYGF